MIPKSGYRFSEKIMLQTYPLCPTAPGADGAMPAYLHSHGYVNRTAGEGVQAGDNGSRSEFADLRSKCINQTHKPQLHAAVYRSL
jgi:hypothetical protein